MVSNMNEWTPEEVDFSIKEKGIVHYFNPDKKAYLAVAFPSILGPLKHIYQNELYMFDLIDSFEVQEVVKDGKPYLMYKFPGKVTAGTDKFEFLWKDKK